MVEYLWEFSVIKFCVSDNTKRGMVCIGRVHKNSWERYLGLGVVYIKALSFDLDIVMESSGRLAALRGCMGNKRYVKEPLSAYIILTDDAHQVSYRKVAPEFILTVDCFSLLMAGP